MQKKIGFISLGCPKNQVDSEMMLAKLSDAGFILTDTPVGADAVIINTCGFIEEAKQEAIDNILEMAQLKEDGDLGKIIVLGCMAERYRDEILKEMPEVDAVAGLGANGQIVEFVNNVFAEKEESRYPDKEEMPLGDPRILSTPPHWAYLKVADGCSNRCSYCAIPDIRGPFRSRPMEDIIKEAASLAMNGIKELILIAQDTTRYGEDLYDEKKLPELLTELNKLDGIRWIRLLYCYPDRITDELLSVMRDCEKVLPYIDLPIQHADGKILKAMNRSGDDKQLLALLEKIRSYLPDCVLRTTLITGFPGEDEQAFETLAEFVQEARFDRLGCFAYSAEDGTPAAEMDNQIDREIAQKRGESIMDLQYRIFTEKQESLVDTVQTCIVDAYDSYNDIYIGRTWRDAPEIDSTVYFVCDYELTDGSLVQVEIQKTEDVDLVGRVCE